MADNGKIDVDGLPARPAGNLDSIVGVDKATRQAAQFPVTALPMPQGVVSAIQQQNATIEAVRASQGSGLPSYATRAALPAPGTLPRPVGGGDPLVTVTNDPDPGSNGAWRDTGTEWIKSADRASGLEARTSALELEAIETVAGKNLFDRRRARPGYSVSVGSQSIIPGPNGRLSGYIPVETGATYTVSGNQDAQNGAWLSAPNDDAIISAFTSVSAAPITAPAGARYLVFNITNQGANNSEYDGTTQVEEGSVATAYEPYSNSIQISTVKGLPSELGRIDSRVDDLDASAVVANLFPNPELTVDGSTTYQAQRIVEAGEPVLRMVGDINQVAIYTIPVGRRFAPGDVVSFEAEIWSADAPSDTGNNVTGDVNIFFYDENGGTLGTLPSTHGVPTAETWYVRQVSRTIEPGTVSIGLRFVKRANSSEVKFRRPVVRSSNEQARVVDVFRTPAGQSAAAVVVSPGGEFPTIQDGVNAAGPFGTVVVMEGDYHENVTLSGFFGRIVASGTDRVRIIGGIKLDGIVKTAGQSKVYQAALPNEPNRYVFEHDTPDVFTEIDAEDRHPLQRGETYRLPSTRLFKAASIAEVDSATTPAWFWEDGTLYFSTSDGAAPGVREYYVPRGSAACVEATAGSFEISGITTMYGLYGFRPNGCHSVRLTDCSAMCNRGDGFAMFNNGHVALTRPRAGGNGNDGTNGHASTNVTHFTQLAHDMVDAWLHDNWDDGDSLHERCVGTYIGGLYEFNGSGVATAYGAHVTQHGGLVRKNGAMSGNGNPNPKGFGVSSIGLAVDGGDGTQMVCYGTVSEGNNHNFHASSAGNTIDCFRTQSIDGVALGHIGVSGGRIRLYDCGDSGSTTTKSGDVVVRNTATVT